MENSKNNSIEQTQEISYLTLFDNAKKSIQTEDIKNGLYYLNLVINSEGIKNDLNTKFLCLIFMNQIFFKQKNEIICLNQAKKILKLILSKKYKLMSSDIQILFLSVLYCAANLLDENNKNLLASLLLYNAKNFIDELSIDSEDRNYQLIMKGFSANMLKLNEYIPKVRVEVENKSNEFSNLLNMLSNIDQKYKNKSPNKSYYLIATPWFNNMITFLKTYTEKLKDSDNIFYVNNIALLYIDKEEDDPEDREEFMGSYPGPINNFFLIKGCDIWVDPVDLSSNRFLYKNIVEGRDFKLVPAEVYDKLKNVFGCYEEIERKSHELENDIEVEIHYQKIKVLFINEYLRDGMKEAITVKSIQVSRNTKLEEFKEKLLRCFKNINPLKFQEEGKENSSLFDIKLFKIDKIQEIFNLIISHVNKNKFYKLNSEELKFTNDSNSRCLKDLNFFSLKKETTIIAEVLPKNMIVKPFIRVQSEVISCSQCQAKIPSRDSIVYCDSCTQSTYCSDYCKNLDDNHKEFHKKISSIFKKKFSLSSLKEVKIESFLDPYSKAGIVGVKNYGNTCFISAAVHLLANCHDLIKYFLSKMYLEEINKSGKKSAKGQISKVFYELIKDYWLGAQEIVQPYELKQIVANITSQIPGMNLNDSHDMIILLLRALSEDLNRTKESNTAVANFSEKAEGESDLAAAERWWNSFATRENSIITDLFYGQFKTQMRCPSCKKTQTTYEPFMTLGLPIGEKSDSVCRFKVFTSDFKYEYFQIELRDIDKFTSVKHLKDKVHENPLCKSKEYDVLLLKDKEVVKALPEDELIYDHVFQRIDFTQEVFIEWEIIMCEVEQSFSNTKNKGDFVNFYVCPFNSIKEDYLYFWKSETKSFLCYPKAICLSKKAKLRDLYVEVFRYFRRIMENVEGRDFEEFYENILDKKYVEAEFNAYFSEPKDKTLKESNELQEIKEKETINSNETENDLNKKEEKEKENEEETDAKTYKDPFLLYLTNNIPQSRGYFSQTPKCEYCDSHCKACLIANEHNTTVYEFFARQRQEREFILHADFSLFKSNFKKFYFENTDYDDPIMSSRGDISIYECFEQFSKESKIEKDKDKDKEKIKDVDKENFFFCKTCNKNLKGFKKVEVFKAPNILIIQLKRFKLKVASLMELVQNRKNEAHVDFQGYLDLSRFILGPDKEKAKYELLSVCQHTGKMGAGKYSAVVRSIKDNNWYEFVDENFKEISAEEISNPSVYLLVYRKIELIEDEKDENKEKDKLKEKEKIKDVPATAAIDMEDVNTTFPTKEN